MPSRFRQFIAQLIAVERMRVRFGALGVTVTQRHVNQIERYCHDHPLESFESCFTQWYNDMVHYGEPNLSARFFVD